MVSQMIDYVNNFCKQQLKDLLLESLGIKEHLFQY